MNKVFILITLFAMLSFEYTEEIQGKAESCYEIEVKAPNTDVYYGWSVFDGGLKDIKVKVWIK